MGSAQHFELGWTIITAHRLDTWKFDQTHPTDEPWELYDTDRDPGEVTNLAARYPAKVAELSALFEKQAITYNVDPIGNVGDSRKYRTDRAMTEFRRRKGVWLFPGPVTHVPEDVAPPILTLPFKMTASIEVAWGDETGPIFTLGGSTGGLGLYLKRGVPHFAFRGFDGSTTVVTADRALQSGKSPFELDLSRGRSSLTQQECQVTMRIGDETIADRSVACTMPFMFGVFQTFDIGTDHGSTVSVDYLAGASFPGKIGETRFSFMPRNRGLPVTSIGRPDHAAEAEVASCSIQRLRMSGRGAIALTIVGCAQVCHPTARLAVSRDQTRSQIAAMPCPPPMHIVVRPRRRPVRASS